MARKLPPQFEVEITEVSRIGEGVGMFNNKKVFVFGVLPGEKALVRPLKKRRRGVKAAVVKILRNAEVRRKAREDHYLSCSPWQIIDENIQRKWKIDIVKKMFINEAGRLPSKNVIIRSSPENWNYRNKMEFSFTNDHDGLPILAFHQRFRYWDYSALDSCVLAKQRINEAAQKILAEIRKRKLKRDDLKNLLLRYSNKEDKCIAALYVVNREFPVFNIENSILAGWQIIYSDPQSPSTVITEQLYKAGSDSMQERIGGLDLKFYFDGFFQVNVDAFDLLLDYLQSKVKASGVLSDLYSGVGTIGFSLANKFKKIYSIEFDDRAVEAARENASKNNILNINFSAGAAEKQSIGEYLKITDTLVVDPPRSGLHPKVLKKIIKHCPENFIYVSCNPHTQAQNYKELCKIYKVQDWRLFDLYPQTPHVESVIIMKKKNILDKIFGK